MIVHSVSLFVHFAEQYKPLALYSGAAIVTLSAVRAALVFGRGGSADPKGDTHADAL